MLKEIKYIDIEQVPELVRIAEEVRDSQEPRVLRKGKEPLAVVVPVSGEAGAPQSQASGSLADGYSSVPALGKKLSIKRMVEIAADEHARETAREAL